MTGVQTCALPIFSLQYDSLFYGESSLNVLSNIYYSDNKLFVKKVPSCSEFSLTKSVLSTKCSTPVQPAKTISLDLNECLGYDEKNHLVWKKNGNFAEHYSTITLEKRKLIRVNKITKAFDLVDVMKGISLMNNELKCKENPIIDSEEFESQCHSIIMKENVLTATCGNKPTKLNILKCVSMSSDKTKMEWKYTSYQDLKKIGSGVLNCELIKRTILRCNNKFEIDLSQHLISTNGELKCQINNELYPPTIVPSSRPIDTCEGIIVEKNKDETVQFVSGKCKKETEDDELV